MSCVLLLSANVPASPEHPELSEPLLPSCPAHQGVQPAEGKAAGRPQCSCGTEHSGISTPNSASTIHLCSLSFADLPHKPPLFFFIIRPGENACASNAFNEVILWKPDMLNKPGVILYPNNSVGAAETVRALLSKTWSLLKAVSVFYKTSASFPFLKPNPSLKACCVICWLPGCCNC